MSSVRNIFRDLVDKRLWPVALLMVVAIAAIPILFGGGSSSGAGDKALPIAPGGAANASSAVELLGPPSVRKRAGKVVDPFRRSATTPESAAGAAGTDETGEQVGGAAGGAGGGSSTDPGSNDGAQDQNGSTVDKAGPSAYDLTKVADVRFGKRGDTLKRIRNLAPLSELPSGDDAIVLFAGALKNKSVARFIIVAGSAGTTEGTGECKLQGKNCISVDMEAGDRQVFRVDGKEYELELVGINSVKSAGSTKTGTAYASKVRFGSSSSAGARTVDRLAPLGGSSNPALLYLGVYKDGKRALFVVGPNASADTNGDCMDAACRIIGLSKGDGGKVRVSSRSYVVKLHSVSRRTLTSKGAATARARVAGGGRDALRKVLKHGPTASALSHFGYSPARGTISPASSSKG